MRVGIYINDVTPEAGGASSLLATIKKEIICSNDNNEYIICFDGNSDYPYKTEKDNLLYVNINRANSITPKNKFRKKILRRCKNIIKNFLLMKHTDIDRFSAFDVIARKENIDIFWITSPCICEINYPYMYTVWDLGHRSTPFFPEVSRSGWLWQERENTYQKMLYKASYILTGNENGKKEILENYPMPENKIRIVPFPVASFCHKDEEKVDFNLPEKFFFYPAQFWPHKNHIRILEALKILRDDFNLMPTVVFTGSDKGNKKYIIEQSKNLGIENQIIFAGFVSDGQLKYLYTHATAMVFASLMGPNNMPPIEATFLNCPVIITDLEGHKEQLEDTAIYFNGYDERQLADCLKKILTDENLRNGIINKEKALAEKFADVNYFGNVKKILDEFALIRKTWGEDFVHL